MNWVYVLKVLYSVLPSLIEGSPFDSGVPNVATSRDVDSVLNVMQSVYDLMSEYCLNRGIIAQVFYYLWLCLMHFDRSLEGIDVGVHEFVLLYQCISC